MKRVLRLAGLAVVRCRQGAWDYNQYSVDGWRGIVESRIIPGFSEDLIGNHSGSYFTHVR